MTTCPCCSDKMLQHIRHSQIYWFCRSCWQEMPSWEAEKPYFYDLSLAIEFTILQRRMSLAKVAS